MNQHKFQVILVTAIYAPNQSTIYGKLPSTTLVCIKYVENFI